MATLQGDEELWKLLNSKRASFTSSKDVYGKPLNVSDIWAYKTQPIHPAVDDSDDDDDIPEVDIEESGEENESESFPSKGRATDCSECNEKFNTPEELAKHEKIHLAESNYICEECGEGFGMKKALKSHLTVHKEEKKFECDTCLKKFDYRDNLLFHMRIHKKIESYDCDICHLKFTTKEFRDKHAMKHVVSVQDKNNPNRVLLMPMGQTKPGKGSAVRTPVAEVFACDMCNQKYIDKVSLENHKIVHIKHKRGPQLIIRKKPQRTPVIKFHSCPKCDERFENRTLYMVHLASCTHVKFYSCSKCGGKFHHKLTFKNHVASCDGSTSDSTQSVTCAFCKKLYEVPVESKHDGSQAMKFICEPCCTHLAQKSQVSGFTPRLENRFICNKCERCFSTEESLREHIHSHAADCYYACPKCDEKKYFMTKKALQEHLASHRAAQKKLPSDPTKFSGKPSSKVTKRISKNPVKKLHSPSKSGNGRQSARKAERNLPALTSKKSDASVNSFTGFSSESFSEDTGGHSSRGSPSKARARSPENRLYSSSRQHQRPDKRPRLVENAVEKEVVRVKTEPSDEVDDFAVAGTHSQGGIGSCSHLYYSEDTSDAKMQGTFSLVRGNSSDEENDEENLLELDVFIKNEIQDDVDENDTDDSLGSCTVFNPVRPKDTLGVSLNIPDKVFKQEDVSNMVTKQAIQHIPDKVIKPDPDGVDSVVIKQEQLDEEELTIKEELEYFNGEIKDDNSAYQDNFEFTPFCSIPMKEEPDS